MQGESSFWFLVEMQDEIASFVSLPRKDEKMDSRFRGNDRKR
jgi:hypothetical protein